MLYLPGEFTPENLLAMIELYRYEQVMKAFRQPGYTFVHFYEK